MKSSWVIRETSADIELMSGVLGISSFAARVLANRGIRSRNDALKYLYPSRKFLHDALDLKDMENAVYITFEAIKSGKKIAVFGDYDVDGVASTVILHKTIKNLGGNVMYYVPHRRQEGYGINTSAVKKLKEQGVDLIIAVDNGISAIKEITFARNLEMNVIVIDHHEPYDNLPNANAVIDHKRRDDTYLFKHLCAGALCYKFAQELYKKMDADWIPVDNEMLIFAGLATICDIVPLIGENRIITVQALAAINRGITNTGLRTLLEMRGYAGKTIGVYEAGFIIGPCINAAGRLESADIAIELFLLGDSPSDTEKARELAFQLSNLNDRRKALTNEGAERVLEMIGKASERGDKVYVMYDEQMPESIAGIVAGRIKENINRPIIMLTDAAEPGFVKGSARSIESYNIYKALYDNDNLFERFGGHDMAAGLTMKKENIELLRKKLNDECVLNDEDFIKKIHIDAEITMDSITVDLARELERLAPFGAGNAEPLFMAKGVLCEAVDRIGGDKKTLRFAFTGERNKIKGITFGMYEKFYEAFETTFGENAAEEWAKYGLKSSIKMDIAFFIEINEYNGACNVQVRVVEVGLII